MAEVVVAIGCPLRATVAGWLPYIQYNSGTSGNLGGWQPWTKWGGV